jgi:predicted NUDIX family NTP pyrophosphohydrolase
MAKRSAGLLMYRLRNGVLEVFLVHPGGPFWAKKDLGAWSIPKGEYPDGDEPLAAAKREFEEETGIKPEADFTALRTIKQPGGKTVLAWVFEGDGDASSITSNKFSMEWPPHSGNHQEFPEVDRAAWFNIETAREKILKGQLPLLEELERLISQPRPSSL